MTLARYYPIGTPGKPWGAEEKAAWYAARNIFKRSYESDVLARLTTIEDQGFERIQYGTLPWDTTRYPLYALRSKHYDAAKPNILVTGGVHGYETSGVKGALAFAEKAAKKYMSHFNFVVCPCISPWGYETINRWNPKALDPNRNFIVGDNKGAGSPVEECANVMSYVLGLGLNFLAHFDLHETTDSDENEFCPALSAREGKETHERDIVPDGFYLVANSSGDPQPEFQKAMIESVRAVTHIAPADDKGNIIGLPVQQEGVIHIPAGEYHLCMGFTGAKYVTTTEVYPDSPKTNDEECNAAQVACVCGGLDYILKKEQLVK